MSERTQKLLRLAQALEILRERLLADAVDPTTAAALREQLSGTLAELSALRRLVGDSPATEATRRLYLALEALELSAQSLPVTNVIAISRPAARRARRFDETARRLIARAAAVALLIEAASPLTAAAAPGVNLDITNATPATAASGLIAQSRAVTFNRVGERNTAQSRLTFGTQALAAINGDTSPAATAALFSFHCQVNLGACIFGGGVPDKTRLAPQVLGYIALQTNALTYLDAPPQPEEMLDTLTGTIGAISQGSGAFAGGDGEPGGTVTLTNTAAVGSTGDYAAGLLAKSVGGTGVWNVNLGLFNLPVYTNGGAAGPVTVDNRGAITTTGISSPAIAALSVGGLGVQGGRGGEVTVTTTGALTTSGSGAHGVLAQSMGGRSINDSPSVTGGVAGRILVTIKSAVVTTGAKAYGVLARSLGGEGSRGDSASGVDDSSNAGGRGGDAGTVRVDIASGGAITTSGAGAHAVAGFSLGGQGGQGGGGNNAYAGATGGDGGLTGDVTLTNAGTLKTSGDRAYGMLGQSLAGKGGDGGDGDSIFVGQGGKGGASAPGGVITMTNTGTIATQGLESYGMFGQSLGGVGGDGGSSDGIFYSDAGNGGTAESARCRIYFVCPDGGAVSLSNMGSVTTQGARAHALFLESIGGGGGNGGSAGGWISVSGGSGGDAGNGGLVTAINGKGATLSASGQGASAIFAQSVGGGGGNGGDAFGAGAFASVAVGGAGGAGGKGGAVVVQNDGLIKSSGLGADAIFAQSIGGGGGKGGSATAISVGAFVSASVAVGGSGGAGGDASTVNVKNTGAIEAAGDFANAIFAQSVGGGGGAGGQATSVAIAGGDKVAVAISVSVGGSGGDGGAGMRVDVTNTGALTTYDFNASGVFAQSVGGGGGRGGDASASAITAAAGKGTEVNVSVAVGGSGGKGGAGDIVNVDNGGLITTYGDGSTGIFAQSVGGGGGAGGDASATTAAFNVGGQVRSAEIKVAVGGHGGAAGDGALVKVVNTGAIVTLGASANGVTAQSVGGGGGNGGAGSMGSLLEGIDIPTVLPDGKGEDNNTSLKQKATDRYATLKREFSRILSNPGSFGKNLARDVGKKTSKAPDSIAISIGVGGYGGAAGKGGEVALTSTGEIVTAGFMSSGVFAQSVGGGGGSGGGGDGSATGDMSIGGGLGGAGGSSGAGSSVTVTNEGAISTLGDLSYGVLAQSVGGGGGIGGTGAGEISGGYSFSLSIGGKGGSVDNGGAVKVAQEGDVVTFGASSAGVLAQSVGGGGGIGGAANASNYLNVALGGSGTSGGDGGDVEVSVKGAIATSGKAAYGVLAQSVGGGGGLGGGVVPATLVFGVDPLGLVKIDTGVPYSVASLGMGGGGGKGGNGGAIKVTTTGAITTTGEGAHGVYAQSIGGGGGIGGTGANSFPAAIALSGSNGDKGVAGAITIAHAGDIKAFGDGAHGILAQSVGGAGSNGRGADINITVNGAIAGGANGGAGIFMAGGGDNHLTIGGGSVTAKSYLAILGSDGDDAVDNSGRVIGNVGLGGGANSFTNRAAGVVESAQVIALNGGIFANAGLVSPSGAGVLATTALLGNFTQGATGALKIDARYHAGAADRIDVSGAAALAGHVILEPYHVLDLIPGKYVTALSAASLTHTGISANTSDTLVIDYGLRATATELQVGTDKVDFVLAGLSPNQVAITRHIQASWAAGGTPAQEPLLDDLAYQKNRAAYVARVDTLDPGAGPTQGVAPLMSSLTFVGGLMSCPGGEGATDVLHEGACYWAKAGGGSSRRSAGATEPGYQQHAMRLQAGGQFALSQPGWFGGLSLGLEDSQFDSGAPAHSRARRIQAGAVIKREMGPLLLAAAGSYQYSRADLSRAVNFPIDQVSAGSHPVTNLASLRLRAAYTAQGQSFYVRPSLEGEAYHLGLKGYRESGAPGLNLIVRDGDQSFTSGTANLEIGGTHVTAKGLVLRPYANVGITRFSESSWDVTARLESAPAAAPDFTVKTELPQQLTRAALGLEADFERGAIRVEYETRQGDRYRDDTAAIKLRMQF
ncbi:autotransporter outer membrane beta-barrel domain-containing protein [Phenylobacterium sp.]|uniref:autotransporter outer membrane beta-barrel domain-containing protein n=1 Tax=Phenylobacterium sp. TaxID=1871053 RepID=UPI0027176DBB|nr:autotransporter outer membrane beta-barrel domain-containing protein [Phenylobacterium sp.]MDO8800729.1 autotransporter outer membrane beta-barrel domain-containing protein [Phenylobacterium sp.]